MSALAAEIPALGTGRLALLGTGTVGSAFVQRYQALQARGLELPSVQWLANSRTALAIDRDLALPLELARRAPRDGLSSPPWASAEGLERGCGGRCHRQRRVAARHVQWLARGVHVVTANKLGRGAQLARATAIAESCADSGARYGDSATVGAGLPLLSSLRALVAGGDRIHAIEGVLSGSLAWLFHRYDGQSPFSAAVREALAAGYTEPDPRLDLSGEDVRRKLLILAQQRAGPGCRAGAGGFTGPGRAGSAAAGGCGGCTGAAGCTAAGALATGTGQRPRAAIRGPC